MCIDVKNVHQGRHVLGVRPRQNNGQSYLFVSIYVDKPLCCVWSPPLQNNQNKTRPTLKSSHQQLSSHLALSSHMLNEFILPVLPVVENSDVNLYAMGLVATQRPKTKCFHLGQFCEWLCLLLLVGDQRPPFARTAFLCSSGCLLWPYSHCRKCVLFYEFKEF